MPSANSHLNGQIFYVPGNDDIYWIDNGLARHIVDEATYHGVFGGSPNKQADNSLLTDITVGPPVAHGTKLVRAGDDARIYLVEANVKRWIPDETTKARFQLNGNVHSLPLATVNSFANGPTFVDPGPPSPLPNARAITVIRQGAPSATNLSVSGTGFTPNSAIVIRVTPNNLLNPTQFQANAGSDGKFTASSSFACQAGVRLTVTAFEDANPTGTLAVAPDITC